MFYVYLRIWDATLSLAIRRSTQTIPLVPPRPHRILVANTGHVGDAVLASCVLPALKSAFPHAELGFLCAGWSRSLFQGHPLLSWVHSVDHWRLNRDDVSLVRKFARYLCTRRRAIKEICAVGYGAAIDLYSFYPNAADVFWTAGIPIRLGHTTGGFGALYTRAIEWRHQTGRHISEYHSDLLRELGVTTEHLREMRPVLAPPAPEVLQKIRSELAAHGIEPQSYVMLHMGTGDIRKEWPRQRWRELARRLRVSGHRLVFTGRGERERRLIEFVAREADKYVNLCDQLDLPGLAAVAKDARAVVTLDTAAAHLAAASGAPTVAVWTGLAPAFWRPLANNIRIVSHRVPCSPCFLGCSEMECVKEVSVESVYQALKLGAVGADMLPVNGPSTRAAS